MSFTVPENAALARARNSNPGAWERFEKAERERIARRDAERARELIERLRARKGGWESNISYAAGAGILVNPDGPEAATVIETLLARLEAAEECSLKESVR